MGVTSAVGIELTGMMLIGARAVRGTEGEIDRGADPATGKTMEPAFGGGSICNVRRGVRVGGGGVQPLPRAQPGAAGTVS